MFRIWIGFVRFYLFVLFVGGLVLVDRIIFEICVVGIKDWVFFLIVCVCILYSCVFIWIYKFWLFYCIMLNNILICWFWIKRMNIRFFYFYYFIIIIVLFIYVYKWFFIVWVDCDIYFYLFILIKFFFLIIKLCWFFWFFVIVIKKEFLIKLIFII